VEVPCESVGIEWRLGSMPWTLASTSISTSFYRLLLIFRLYDLANTVIGKNWRLIPIWSVLRDLQIKHWSCLYYGIV